MGSVNKVILIGHLGNDPEIHVTPTGLAIANFRIATSEQWKDKAGEKQERTEWHRVVCLGKLAELARDYLAKGRQVYVEGSLQTREWEKDGEKRYTTEVKASHLVFLGKAEGKSERTADPSRERTSHNGSEYAPKEPTGYRDPSDDDIPF